MFFVKLLNSPGACFTKLLRKNFEIFKEFIENSLNSAFLEFRKFMGFFKLRNIMGNQAHKLRRNIIIHDIFTVVVSYF